MPRRNKEFIAWPGGLEETRHTLAFTSDGRRYHLQGNWQVHEESIDTTKERIIGYTRLELELLGTELAYCDWATMDFIGYSWIKHDQFAATKDLPFFDAMMSRPQRLVSLADDHL